MSDIKEYPAITPYGYIKDGKVFLKGYLEHPDREVGVVRESDEASLQYFIDRFTRVEEKIQAVEEAIATTENKGSYLMKLLHMRHYLETYNGLGDFIALLDKIKSLEDNINEYILVNREKNEKIKQALLEEAEALKDSTNWKYSSVKMKELKQKWIKTGSAHKEEEERLAEAFDAAMEHFFERRKVFYTEQNEIMNERIDQYEKLIEELRAINRQGNPMANIPRIKSIQRDWKNVGRINKIRFKRLTFDFKREIEQYFYSLKLQKAASEKSGIELKRELFRDTEYILETGVPFDIMRVKQIQDRWKDMGKLPEAEDKELNLKFRIVCNEIFETHFLEKTARTLYRDLYKKTFEEQVRVKLRMLEESIRKDEDELYEFSIQNGISPDADARTISDFNLLRVRNNIINKMKTKQRIQRKLREKLSFTNY
jgi:hypothetical protein